MSTQCKCNLSPILTHHSAVHQSFGHELAEEAELGFDLVDVRHFGIACERHGEQTAGVEHVRHRRGVVTIGVEFVAFHRVTAPQIQLEVLQFARDQRVELQRRTKTRANLTDKQRHSQY